MGRPDSLGWLSGTTRLAHDKIAVEEDLSRRQVRSRNSLEHGRKGCVTDLLS
jgi:hypothetical protein